MYACEAGCLLTGHLAPTIGSAVRYRPVCRFRGWKHFCAVTLALRKTGCTAFFFPFMTISSIFTFYRHHYHCCSLVMLLITRVALSLFGRSGICIVTSRFGREVNRDMHVEALHATMRLIVWGVDNFVQ